VIARVQCLRVDRGWLERARPLEHRLERAAAQIAGARRLHQVEDRRHQVDVLHQVRDPASRAGVALLLDDERHVDRLVVDEQAVLLLAMIAESFAVIRHQHDRRTVVELMRLQVLHQAADDFVAVRDLAVVGRVRREACRRCVRLVRLVEMEKQKRARRADGVEPVFGDFFGFAAVALDLADRELRRTGWHLAVEEIEPLADARLFAQHVRRHDAAGRESALA
jgi:hypothetical protein